MVVREMSILFIIMCFYNILSVSSSYHCMLFLPINTITFAEKLKDTLNPNYTVSSFMSAEKIELLFPSITEGNLNLMTETTIDPSK